jgi:phenylacetate-coenzyme A ligase PaaK-like adenylate-forming protein
MSNFLATAKTYLNFALGLRAYLDDNITLEDAKYIVAHQVAHREENFLITLKANIFDSPSNPYLALFKWANITYNDVERMISNQGLESTLEELYEAGIYAEFEEIKGRNPIIREGLEIHASASDFDTHTMKPVMVTQSSGSTGTPTHTKFDFEHLKQKATLQMLSYHMFDCYKVPTAVWKGLFPLTSGFGNILQLNRIDHVMERWFTPLIGRQSNLSVHFNLLNAVMITMLKLQGAKVPNPEYVPLDDPLPIVKWAVDAVQREGACVVRCNVSKAVRISNAAQKHGYDLTSVIIVGGSEPLTKAKNDSIEKSGAKFVSNYGMTETGNVGMKCGNPIYHDDIHHTSNSTAFIQRPIEIFDQTVNAFCFTTLLTTTPKTLINARLDDFGIVETRDCGCLLHQLGLTTHLRQVRSYRKLTGEGMTLVGSDMVRILEEDLPARFGGSLTDYQLVEEEADGGLTKLMLYVDPAVPIENEEELQTAFLDAMRDNMPSARLAQAEYRYGDVVQIRRETPIRTSRQKHFPIRTLYKQNTK